MVVQLYPPSGTGDVDGPASSTDNAIARWDGTAGTSVQNSSAFVTDAGVVYGPNTSGGFRTQATAVGTTTLVAADGQTQEFTGVTTQIVVLPVVTTLPQAGYWYRVVNKSTGALTVNSSGGNLVQTVAAGGTLVVANTKITADTTAAGWSVSYLPATTQTLTNGDTNPVSSDAVFDGLALKQNALTGTYSLANFTDPGDATASAAMGGAVGVLIFGYVTYTPSVDTGQQQTFAVETAPASGSYTTIQMIGQAPDGGSLPTGTYVPFSFFVPSGRKWQHTASGSAEITSISGIVL